MKVLTNANRELTKIQGVGIIELRKTLGKDAEERTIL